MKLMVNGEQRTREGQGTLADLLRELRAPEGHVAIILNGTVLRRDRFVETQLNEHDNIEIIAFAGGG
jgi:thiamine biosynthesis protein ThiS